MTRNPGSRIKSPSEKANLFQVLHSLAVHSVARIFSRKYRTLSVIDPIFKNTSPLDRDGFRRLLESLSAEKQQEIIGRLAQISKEVIQENLEQNLEERIDKEKENQERMFHNMIIDFFEHIGRTKDTVRTWQKNGIFYSLVKSEQWCSEPEILISSRWASFSNRLAEQLLDDVETEGFCLIVVVFRDCIRESISTRPGLKIKTLEQICLQESEHIFNEIGVSWINI